MVKMKRRAATHTVPIAPFGGAADRRISDAVNGDPFLFLFLFFLRRFVCVALQVV